jgi:Na+/melibiose symporter-like transporter
MRSRWPIWFKGATPGATSFAVLFGLESFARAIVGTLIIYDVKNLTQSDASTSAILSAVACVGLLSNFAIPPLAALIGRRWVYTLGAVSLIAASLLMLPHHIVPQIGGMILRLFGVVCFNVCHNLYILDTLKGQQLNKLEPRRMLAAALPWTLGPGLGVQLAKDIGHSVPFFVSIAFTLLLITYFWFLRTKDDSPLPVMRRPPASPLRHVRAFFSTPRLRLAYVIAIARSTYWSMFFAYTPLYCLSQGLGEKVGGYLVSAGNAFLFLAPVVGWCGRRWGIKRMIIGGFCVTALAGFGAAGFASWPWIGAGCLVGGAFAAVVLDVTGNLPFLRMVRPSERMTMTPLYATYRDFSELVPQAVFSVLMRSFGLLPVVFIATGLGQATAAFNAWRLPRRL